MRVVTVLAMALLASCNQNIEETNNFPAPYSFAEKGRVTVERYNYGGAMGGYRYIVYFEQGDERHRLYKGQSNKLVAVEFPDNRSVVLNMCGEGTSKSDIRQVETWQRIVVQRAC